MNPRVVLVNAMDDYILELTFDNGEYGLFSMKPYLEYPVYSPLKNYDLFRKAHAVFGFVSWGEEIDMSPDNFYLESKITA
jgi:hypothetical protein